MEPVSPWVELQRNAAELSLILLRTLRDKAKYQGADTVELCRLGRITLNCLMFRRRLLDRRTGPKYREEKQLEKMEKQVDSAMARLESGKPTDDQTELTEANKELAGFQKQRNLIARE